MVTTSLPPPNSNCESSPNNVTPKNVREIFHPLEIGSLSYKDLTPTIIRLKRTPKHPTATPNISSVVKYSMGILSITENPNDGVSPNTKEVTKFAEIVAENVGITSLG